MPKTKVQKYHDVLRPCMSYIHDGQHFGESHVFTQQELLAVTPQKLLRYLKIKIYGNGNANPDVDPPLHHRSSSVAYMKKAISYFMVNKTTPWNEVAMSGNPTRSTELQQLIRSMKRMETAHLGVPSSARRALTPTEYENLIEMVANMSNEEHAAFAAAYISFQLNMVARLDDTAKWRQPDLMEFEEYPEFGILCKLCWSKNCFEERDAPTQLLIGAMDPRYCALSLIGVWLEYHFMVNPEENDFFFGVGGANDPNSIKRTMASILQRIMQDDDFVGDGNIGSHSLRKLAVTIARRMGCSRDEVDDRGRWKGQNRQQDTYNETTIPYVDAKVAAALCKGGPIAYLVKEASGITNQWVLDYVVPHLVGRIPNQAAVVLGRALLWRVFDTDSALPVPPQISNRVRAAYQGLGDRNTLAVGDNPVRKAPLGVVGIDAQLIVEEILGGGDAGGGGAGGGGGGDRRVAHGMQREEVRLLNSQVMHLRRELADAHAENLRRDMIVRSTLTRLNRNVARLAATPGRRRVGTAMAAVAEGGGAGRGGDPGEMDPSLPVATGQSSRRLVANLSRRPKTLHDLWKEWEYGMAGNKAAKNFTQAERGKVKSQYNIRLQFWAKCEDMVRRGMEPDVACDRIYAAYGQRTSVTIILRNMRRDKKKDSNGRSGWPPLLQPVVL